MTFGLIGCLSQTLPATLQLELSTTAFSQGIAALQDQMVAGGSHGILQRLHLYTVRSPTISGCHHCNLLLQRLMVCAGREDPTLWVPRV